MSFLAQLTRLQIASGVSFALCKIVNILTLVLIFASFADKSMMSLAKISLISGGALVLITLFLGGWSHARERREVESKKNAIDEILSDPESRQALMDRLSSKRV